MEIEIPSGKQFLTVFSNYKFIWCQTDGWDPCAIVWENCRPLWSLLWSLFSFFLISLIVYLVIGSAFVFERMIGGETSFVHMFPWLYHLSRSHNVSIVFRWLFLKPKSSAISQTKVHMRTLLVLASFYTWKGLRPEDPHDGDPGLLICNKKGQNWL